jgi:uncharacterized membrane protein YoaK (UPF0700 family)
VLLAWIAGFVDALGYLALSKVFTAHMSGNAAAVGAELGIGNWHEAMVRGLAIPGFMVGIGVGTCSEVLAHRSGLQARLVAALGLEMALLLGFIVLEPNLPDTKPAVGTLGFFLRVWLLASAMGLQSATLRRAGGTRVRTTYVTGMLTNMVVSAVQYLLRFAGYHFHGQASNSRVSRTSLGRRARMFGMIFFSFLLGGICGGLGEVRWGSMALVAPMAGLLLVALEDWMSRGRH